MLVTSCNNSTFPDITDRSSDLAQFDDILLIEPLGNISVYRGLDFSGFQVADVGRAAYEGLISIDAFECATSAPIALLGSRSNSSIWPRFVVENWKESSTYFRLRSLYLKPIGSIPLFLSIVLNGLEVVDGHAVNASNLYVTYLKAGHVPVMHLDLTIWPGWESRINMVEAYAFAPDGKDWTFCMDDIEIDVFEKKSEDT
jgi:hypothetical protein